MYQSCKLGNLCKMDLKLLIESDAIELVISQWAANIIESELGIKA